MKIFDCVLTTHYLVLVWFVRVFQKDDLFSIALKYHTIELNALNISYWDMLGMWRIPIIARSLDENPGLSISRIKQSTNDPYCIQTLVLEVFKVQFTTDRSHATSYFLLWLGPKNTLKKTDFPQKKHLTFEFMTNYLLRPLNLL